MERNTGSHAKGAEAAKEKSATANHAKFNEENDTHFTNGEFA